MKTLVLAVLMLVLTFSTGCRVITYESEITYDIPIETEIAGMQINFDLPITERKKFTLWSSFFDTALEGLEVTTDRGRLKVGKFTSDVNEEALKAVVETAIRAALIPVKGPVP